MSKDLIAKKAQTEQDLKNHQTLHGGAKKEFRLDFIGLALQKKKIGFEKVIVMIDDMVAVLERHEDDDHMKEYVLCSLISVRRKRKQ